MRTFFRHFFKQNMKTPADVCASGADETNEVQPHADQQGTIAPWEIVLITLLDAYAISFGGGMTFLTWFSRCPFWLSNLIVTVLLVAVLNYLILPVAQHLLRRWHTSRHRVGTHTINPVVEGEERGEDLCVTA